MNKSGGSPAKRKKIVLCSAVAGVVLVIFLTVIGILCLTGGKENDEYYVEFNGTRYTPGETQAAMSLTSGETYEFCVLSDTGAKAEYSAKITSNPEKNFSFQVGNEQRWFYDENETWNDYSQIFTLTQEGEKITLTVPKNFSLRKAIEDRHDGKVTLEDGTKLEVGSYFQLVITLEEKEFSIDISIDIPITNIEIDPPWIMF